MNFFNDVYAAIFILYVTRSLGVSPGVLGVALGVGAVGGIIGAAAGRVSRRLGVGPTFVLGFCLFQAPLALVPLATGARPVAVALIVVAELGTGFGLMLLARSTTASDRWVRSPAGSSAT